MRPLLAITHLPEREHGLAAAALESDGRAPLRLHMDEIPRPELADVAGIVVFGGAMGVPDVDRYPFLAWELDLLARSIDAEVPVLGVCLGAQLLAQAAGGHVWRLERPVAGWFDLEASAADGDRVFGRLPRRLPVLEWHGDAIEPPPAAEVLAQTSAPGCSVFRVGPAAWGTQLHFELTPEMIAGWLEDPALRTQAEDGGVDPDALLADAPRRLAPQMAAGKAVFERFAALATA